MLILLAQAIKQLIFYIKILRQGKENGVLPTGGNTRFDPVLAEKSWLNWFFVLWQGR
jgi:hypothetical protein